MLEMLWIQAEKKQKNSRDGPSLGPSLMGRGHIHLPKPHPLAAFGCQNWSTAFQFLDVGRYGWRVHKYFIQFPSVGKNYRTYWGELKAKPEPRARSARVLRSKPESKAKPKIKLGGVWGGAHWAPPQKLFENLYLKPCNLVYSSSENQFFSVANRGICQIWARIPAKFSYVCVCL